MDDVYEHPRYEEEARLIEEQQLEEIDRYVDEKASSIEEALNDF